MARSIVILVLFLFSQPSLSSSCCGQSPASFTILSLHQTLSLSLGYSLINSQGRVFDNSEEFFLWDDNKKRQISSTNLSIASTISDRHQLFINTSYMEATFRSPLEDGASQNFSDTLIGYNFEVLPEYTYSPWKPIIYLSAFLNIPTGKSIYDKSTLSEGADVTGHNQWGSGLGISLRKNFFPVTLTLQGKVMRLFPKSFHNSRVTSFYDSSISLLGNYNLSFWDLSLNGGLTSSFLSQRKLQPSETVSGTSRVTTLTGGLQRPLNESLSLSLAYSDQTLLGDQKNVILNKTYNLTLNYNYY